MKENETGDTSVNCGENMPSAVKTSNKKSKSENSGVIRQTDPPSIPVCQLYPKGDYPVGQIINYEPDTDWLVHMFDFLLIFLSLFIFYL